MEYPQLKVLSYNIHKGFTSGNGRFVLRHIREAIRHVHADIVFLQEVLGNHDGHRRRVPDWPEGSQFELLADSVWSHFAYGRNAVYTAGHHGNAILSKYPFTFWENLDISTNRVEKRGLLHGIIEIPRDQHPSGKPVHLICVHLGLLEAERRDQIRMICDRVDRCVPHDEPLIMAGDFNDWRNRATPIFCQELGLTEAFHHLTGGHARTFPSWLPALRLDRIYCRGLEVNSVKTFSGKPWSRLSDHAALYSELRMRN